MERKPKRENTTIQEEPSAPHCQHPGCAFVGCIRYAGQTGWWCVAHDPDGPARLERIARLLPRARVQP